MALFTEEAVRANLRVRDGKRVFYLAAGDKLSPAAREWLRQQHVQILPAAEAKVTRYTTLFGATLTEKPEHMTHLRGNILVMKDHPRIAFRGEIDALEADILLAMHAAKAEGKSQTLADLREILQFVRSLIPADVLEETVVFSTLCGMTPSELRDRSHFPQKYYDQPHFMPDEEDSKTLLYVNQVRTSVRKAERAAFAAFRTPEGGVTREDILLALNRLSSLCWILMIRLRGEERRNDESR